MQETHKKNTYPNDRANLPSRKAVPPLGGTIGNRGCPRSGVGGIAGFTLIEMMVVIAITTILAGLTLAYNRSGQKQIILFRDQALIVGVLNRAKSLTVQKFREQNPNLANYDSCGFGVHFEPNGEFILFEDLGTGGCGVGFDNNYEYDVSLTDPITGAVVTEKIESMKLDNRIKFTGIPAPFDVVFVPPELTVKTTRVGGFPVEVMLETQDGTVKTNVTIGSASQVSSG